MTRIWAGLIAYYRPRGRILTAAFGSVPRVEFPRGLNRLHILASQLMHRLGRLGILGGCFLHNGSLVADSLPATLVHFARALLQAKPSSAGDEEATRLKGRGAKIRALMLAQDTPMLKTREYRGQSHTNCFTGSDFIDLLLLAGEVRSRAAGQSLGRTLMQAGVVRHVLNENDFKDEHRFYRFRVDEQADQASLNDSLGGASVRSALADLRPLVLSGHGRDARTTLASRGVRLPAGVHVVPVFVPDDLMEDLRHATARSAGLNASVASLFNKSTISLPPTFPPSSPRSTGGFRSPQHGPAATEAAAPASPVVPAMSAAGFSPPPNPGADTLPGGAMPLSPILPPKSERDDAKERAQKSPPVDPAAAAKLVDYLDRLSLGRYQEWLVGHGLDTVEQLHASMLKMTPVAMGRPRCSRNPACCTWATLDA